jgi:hypothetical protein
VGLSWFYIIANPVTPITQLRVMFCGGDTRKRLQTKALRILDSNPSNQRVGSSSLSGRAILNLPQSVSYAAFASSTRFDSLRTMRSTGAVSVRKSNPRPIFPAISFLQFTSSSSFTYSSAWVVSECPIQNFARTNVEVGGHSKQCLESRGRELQIQECSQYSLSRATEYWTGGVSGLCTPPSFPLSGANRLLMGLAEHRHGYKKFFRIPFTGTGPN